MRGRCGLFVLLYEIPVWVHFKQGLFTARFDERLVIPLTIGIVFPYNLNDLSACRLFFNCALDGRREFQKFSTPNGAVAFQSLSLHVTLSSSKKKL
jgi:hypothetical protein